MRIRLPRRRPRCRYPRCPGRAEWRVRWKEHPATSALACGYHAVALFERGNPISRLEDERTGLHAACRLLDVHSVARLF